MGSIDSSAEQPPPSEQEPGQPPRGGRWPIQRLSVDSRRLALALLISTLVHTLLLSLLFDGQGLGLPGFGLPWRERRIEVPDLHVVLLPPRVAAAEPAGMPVKKPTAQASIEQPVARGPSLTPPITAAPPLGRTADAMVPKANPTVRAAPKAQAKPAAATGAARAKAPSRTEGPGDAAPPSIAEPAAIAEQAVQRSDQATLAAPAAPPEPMPVIAAAPSASSPQSGTPAPRDAGEAAREQVALEAARIENARLEAERQEAARLAAARLEVARQEAARQEAERVENARLEAERQEAARLVAARQDAALQEAARQEAERVETMRQETERQETARQAVARQEVARQEAARQEAQRVENARLEAERQEAARREAERVETARQETERQETARQAAARQEVARQEEAARQEAQRVETARQETERQEAARQATVRQEAARIDAAQQETERREAARRAIGRQLDEEAARREAADTAAAQPSRLAPSSSTARRARLFGRTDPNAELILYAEAWARKIELNMTIDMVRDAAKRPHTDPLVTVAIRSDGSVESVTFVRSSGVAEIDDAIRHIVQSQLPYQAFPPGLAREFDVIEIRRTWHFDMAVRLY